MLTFVGVKPTTMSDLKKEFQYFLDNQDELVKKYNGKILVIVGNEVVGAYDSVLDAYDSASAAYDDGTYLIQECVKGKEAYMQTFHSRVAFI